MFHKLFEAIFFVLLSTKVKPRRAFFGSFHSWTVIETLSLTTAPHWLTNLVAFLLGSSGLPVASSTTSMVHVSPAFIVLVAPRFDDVLDFFDDPAEG
jgi:hypothetical protein